MINLGRKQLSNTHTYYKSERLFFGLFSRNKRTTPHDSIVINNTNKSKTEKSDQVKPQYSQEELDLVKRRDEVFMELRAEREAKEVERIENKKNIEYASLRSRREFEVTIENLDYHKILIQNFGLFPDTDFESFDELIYYLKDIDVKLTEENILKALKGFNAFSDQVNQLNVNQREYHKFLNLLRESVNYLKDKKTMVELVKFQDIYCVDYPELWVKIDARVIEFCDRMTWSELTEFIGRMANQGEGSDKVYDHQERKFLVYMNDPECSAKECTMLLQAYYNTKRGTYDLFEVLFDKLNKFMKEDDFSDLEVVVRLCLIITDSGKQLLDYVKDMFNLMEQIVLKNTDKLTIERASLIAYGFGNERGSPKLFEELEKAAFKDIDTMDLIDLKVTLQGFVYNYRISTKSQEKLFDKIDSFLTQLNPIEMAKLARALYILEHEKRPAFRTLENLILSGIKLQGHELSIEELYEIVLTFNMTRTASREFYKTLEMALRVRLEEIGKDQLMSQKLFEIYTRSALCSPSFVKELENYC